MAWVTSAEIRLLHRGFPKDTLWEGSAVQAQRAGNGDIKKAGNGDTTQRRSRRFRFLWDLAPPHHMICTYVRRGLQAVVRRPSQSPKACKVCVCYPDVTSHWCSRSIHTLKFQGLQWYVFEGMCVLEWKPGTTIVDLDQATQGIYIMILPENRR